MVPGIKTLDDIQFTKEQEEEIWQGFHTTLDRLADMFGGRDIDGWYLGEKISVVGFVLAAGLTWIRALYGQESKIWFDITSDNSGKLGKFMEQLARYQRESSIKSMINLRKLKYANTHTHIEAI